MAKIQRIPTMKASAGHPIPSKLKAVATDDLKSLPLREVEKKLESSSDGLTPAEAQKRLTQYGPNEIEERRAMSF
jgi:H+-transporting ATPase